MKYTFLFTSLKSVFFIVTLLVLFSCKDKSISDPFVISPANNTNGFVINGDNHVSSTFYMNLADSNRGYYDTARHRTFINVAGDSGKMYIHVTANFLGNGAYGGPVLLANHDTMHLILADSSSGLVQDYASAPAKTVLYINKYDYVNGRINGSFSGPFVNMTNLLDTVQVTNGRFSVLRLADKL